jgi:hypothetical protein
VEVTTLQNSLSEEVEFHWSIESFEKKCSITDRFGVILASPSTILDPAGLKLPFHFIFKVNNSFPFFSACFLTRFFGCLFFGKKESGLERDYKPSDSGLQSCSAWTIGPWKGFEEVESRSSLSTRLLRGSVSNSSSVLVPQSNS